MDAPRKLVTSGRSIFSLLRRYRRLFRNRDAIALVWPTKGERVIQVYSRELKRTISLRRNTSDLPVALKILEQREYDVELDYQPRLIIDAGANIGISSLFLAAHFPEAHIHSIEPEEQNFNLLQLNCNSVPNIVTHRAALWPRRTTLSVVDRQADKWAFSYEEKPGRGDTPAITIADILSEEDASTVDILKLDVEGAEKALFSNGSANWLSLVRTIVIELHDRYVPGCSNAFYSSICDRSFSQEVSGENVIVHFLT